MKSSNKRSNLNVQFAWSFECSNSASYSSTHSKATFAYAIEAQQCRIHYMSAEINWKSTIQRSSRKSWSTAPVRQQNSTIKPFNFAINSIISTERLLMLHTRIKFSVYRKQRALMSWRTHSCSWLSRVQCVRSYTERAQKSTNTRYIISMINSSIILC